MIAAKTTASRATVSPTVFARIGGLPADAVPAASPEVVDYLDRLYNIDERLRSLTQPLIDQIFELVPDIADNKVRRLVLQAKREVFAGQAVSIRAERALRAVAPSGLLSAFDEWSEQLDRRETLECGLREALAADDAKMLRVLVHTVTDPDYLASLALATPELVSRILARRPSKAPSRRLVRSLYNYATRTALKTSPFSGLTTVNVAGTVGQGRSVQAVAVHLASGLLRRAEACRPRSMRNSSCLPSTCIRTALSSARSLSPGLNGPRPTTPSRSRRVLPPSGCAGISRPDSCASRYRGVAGRIPWAF